ncbi:histidine kinase dimerization/phosphoacceptor domain -containing protein [Flavobacterium sangjuense]|nr:histidine kinase dimerization/phosphoacceptor domain -containing protein [Flavobacterium sangjuense]
MWYQDMPQYNYEKSVYYYEKAINTLKQNESLFYEEIAAIYLKRIDYLQINETYNTLDSIGSIGWKYVELAKKNKPNIQLEFDYLYAWAGIKLENGESKKALNLVSKAIALSSEFKSEDDIAKAKAAKGYFYLRYRTYDGKDLALANLRESCKSYENKGIKNNALMLYKIYRGLVLYYSYVNSDSIDVYNNKIKFVLQYIKQPQSHAWYYSAVGRDLNTYPPKNQSKISTLQYRQAKENILKALEIYARYGITKNANIPYAYGILGDISSNQEKYDDAIHFYKKCYQNYKMLQSRKRALDILGFIAGTYELKGDYKNALFYFKQYEAESLNYETEINDRSLKENELQINLLAQDKKLSQKQQQQTIFTIILIITILLLIALYRIYYIKQSNNKKLAHLNDDLETKNHLLDVKNAENELLLREIHHRVKNNLEVVSSLLALQSSQIDDPNTKDAMSESQNRVNSIGIVHQKLYQGTNLGAVEMKDYFLNLSESILDSFGVEQRIDLQLAMENLDLDIDTAVPLGLIVNELLTNCIKYAFPNSEKGTITIKLHKQDNDILRLEIADNGVGKSGVTHGTGFGGQLVSLLTQQLNGTMTEENQNGTKLIFDFKMKAA